jgi:hypothetical protein
VRVGIRHGDLVPAARVAGRSESLLTLANTKLRKSSWPCAASSSAAVVGQPPPKLNVRSAPVT